MKSVVAILTVIMWLGTSTAPDDCASKRLRVSTLQSQFMFQDSLALTIDSSIIKEIDLKGVKSRFQELDLCFYEALYKQFYFEYQIEDAARRKSNFMTPDEYDVHWNRYQQPLYCYSILKKAEKYLLIFITGGKYSPKLSLIACDQNGKYIAGTMIKQDFVDAGQVDIYSSEVQGDNLLVSYITEYETQENGYGESIIDSTVTSWVISTTNGLQKGVTNNYKRRIKW